MTDPATDPVVVVVGAGPAGLRAAEALVRGGVRPILIDEAERPGGQIYRQPPAGAPRAADKLYGLQARQAGAGPAHLPRPRDAHESSPPTPPGDGFADHSRPRRP